MFLMLVLFIIVQRLVELELAKSNTAHLRRRGAQEVGASHYPLMVLLHASWIAAMVWEWFRCPASFSGGVWLGWSFLLLGQGLRWWTISTLGRRWTTRVMVMPGALAVESGPFRLLRHPNYLGVCLEIVGLPLIGGCWRTAIAFGVANALLLFYRIRVEETALREFGCYPQQGS